MGESDEQGLGRGDGCIGRRQCDVQDQPRLTSVSLEVEEGVRGNERTNGEKSARRVFDLMAIMETKNASTGIDEMQTERGITMSGGD